MTRDLLEHVGQERTRRLNVCIARSIKRQLHVNDGLRGLAPDCRCSHLATPPRTFQKSWSVQPVPVGGRSRFTRNHASWLYRERCDPARRHPLVGEPHTHSLERAMGFEPTTPTMARLCSTPELHPLAGDRVKDWRCWRKSHSAPLRLSLSHRRCAFDWRARGISVCILSSDVLTSAIFKALYSPTIVRRT